MEQNLGWTWYLMISQTASKLNVNTLGNLRILIKKKDNYYDVISKSKKKNVFDGKYLLKNGTSLAVFILFYK